MPKADSEMNRSIHGMIEVLLSPGSPLQQQETNRRLQMADLDALLDEIYFFFLGWIRQREERDRLLDQEERQYRLASEPKKPVVIGSPLPASQPSVNASSPSAPKNSEPLGVSREVIEAAIQQCSQRIEELDQISVVLREKCEAACVELIEAIDTAAKHLEKPLENRHDHKAVNVREVASDVLSLEKGENVVRILTASHIQARKQDPAAGLAVGMDDSEKLEPGEMLEKRRREADDIAKVMEMRKKLNLQIKLAVRVVQKAEGDIGRDEKAMPAFTTADLGEGLRENEKNLEPLAAPLSEKRFATPAVQYYSALAEKQMHKDSLQTLEKTLSVMNEAESLHQKGLSADGASDRLRSGPPL